MSLISLSRSLWVYTICAGHNTAQSSFIDSQRSSWLFMQRLVHGGSLDQNDKPCPYVSPLGAQLAPSAMRTIHCARGSGHISQPTSFLCRRCFQISSHNPVTACRSLGCILAQSAMAGAMSGRVLSTNHCNLRISSCVFFNAAQYRVNILGPLETDTVRPSSF